MFLKINQFTENQEKNRRAVYYRKRLNAYKRHSLSIFFMILGVFLAGFGLKGFLLPNSFIDGGATGISLLISEWFKIPLSFLLIIVNIPFVIIAWYTIGNWFALRTAYAITLLSIIVQLIPYPEITHDKLLVSVFGGFFLGAGIGSAIRGGAVIDGTEVLAIAVNRKYRISVGDFILLFNICLFLFATYLLSIETALYSALTYLSASKTVNFIVEGMEQYTGVTIISTNSELIRKVLIEKLGYGVTVYKGERGILKEGKVVNQDILYTVISKIELSRIIEVLKSIDDKAFIIINSIHDTRGGVIHKRSL